MLFIVATVHFWSEKKNCQFFSLRLLCISTFAAGVIKQNSQASSYTGGRVIL